MLIDLQIHSTYSDGYLTPTQVASFLKKQGVKIAALTDHNTVGGVDEFLSACRKEKIKPIVGVELHTKFKEKKFGVLWYNFDHKDTELHDMLRDTQVRRKKIIRRVLEKLVEHGYKFNIDKTLDMYNRYAPINHMVDEFKRLNMKRIIKEQGMSDPPENLLIQAYFKNKKIGVVHNSFVSLERILKLKKKIGGQVILCHPAKHDYIRVDDWKDLKSKGLDGVEILSPHHSYDSIMYIQKIAREIGLIESGGSDFHRHEGSTYLIQNAWQYYRIDSKLLKGVDRIIG